MNIPSSMSPLHQSNNHLPAITVSQLTQAIKLSLEGTFPLVCVQGEISNFKAQSSGHYYFSLKDTQAQIAAVMFRNDAAALRHMPKEGDQVIVKGSLNVYPPRGNYQLMVKELSLVGLGELLLKLEELKVKLLHKGWFSKERKKPLPKFPKRIGVVTSPTGAAIQDILNILTRRYSGFHLILNPVKVQGEGAAQEIAQAIQQFNQHKMVDVMIVGRGGGSIEDLWAFNEEIVADAIYHSEIPIISAVGHETDHCIADYVADLRAPTPSAAAEIVSAETAQHLQHLKQLQQRFDHFLFHFIQQKKQRLSDIKRHPLIASPYALLGNSMQRLDEIKSRFSHSFKNYFKHKKMQLEAKQNQAEALKPTAKITHLRQKLNYWDKSIQAHIGQRISLWLLHVNQKSLNLETIWRNQLTLRKRSLQPDLYYKRLDQYWLRTLNSYKQELKNITKGLNAVNPKNLLTKGYSIIMDHATREVVTTVNTLSPGQEVRLILADGEANSTINRIINNQLTESQL